MTLPRVETAGRAAGSVASRTTGAPIAALEDGLVDGSVARERVRKADDAVRTLYTIGHSTRTMRQLVDLLRAHGVEQIVDVRTIPKSRHNPQFNRPALSRALHNLGWRNASFRGYADYMQSEEFGAGLARLERLAARRPTAIMCAEAIPWQCHRSLIADALTVARWRVLHIQSRHTAQPHQRTTFLRVRSGRLLYPVPRDLSRASRVR